MTFFDDMKGRISQAGFSTVQKAKEMSEVAKLNNTIAETEKQIDALYRKIGSEIYKVYREAPLPEVAEQIAGISDLNQFVRECQLKIQQMTAVRACPECGAPINQEMAFCSECGHKLINNELPKKEVVEVCGICGAPITPESKFCSVCGNKLS